MLLVGVVRGLGFAVVVTATGALAASTLPVERRGEGLGLLGVVSMVPAVTALPAGVWLAERSGSSAAFAAGRRGRAGRRTRRAGSAARRRGRPLARARRHRPRSLRRPGAVAPAVVFTVAAVAGGAVVTFLPDAVTGHAGLAAPALFVQALTATLTRYLGGRWSDRRGPHAPAACPAWRWSAAGMGLAALTGQPGRRAARDGSVRRRLRPGADGVSEPDARGREARAVRRGVGGLERRLRPRLGHRRRRGRRCWSPRSGIPVAFAATAAAAFAMLPLAAAAGGEHRGPVSDGGRSPEGRCAEMSGRVKGTDLVPPPSPQDRPSLTAPAGTARSAAP